MLENYTTLTEIPDSDWEYLPLNESKAGEFEGDHSIKAWRIFKEDGENAKHCYLKLVQNFPNIGPDALFDLIENQEERIKWETRY